MRAPAERKALCKGWVCFFCGAESLFFGVSQDVGQDAGHRKGDEHRDDEAVEADVDACGVDHGRDAEEAVARHGVALAAERREDAACDAAADPRCHEALELRERDGVNSGLGYAKEAGGHVGDALGALLGVTHLERIAQAHAGERPDGEAKYGVQRIGAERSDVVDDDGDHSAVETEEDDHLPEGAKRNASEHGRDVEEPHDGGADGVREHVHHRADGKPGDGHSHQKHDDGHEHEEGHCCHHHDGNEEHGHCHHHGE